MRCRRAIECSHQPPDVVVGKYVGVALHFRAGDSSGDGVKQIRIVLAGAVDAAGQVRSAAALAANAMARRAVDAEHSFANTGGLSIAGEGIDRLRGRHRDGNQRQQESNCKKHRSYDHSETSVVAHSRRVE